MTLVQQNCYFKQILSYRCYKNVYDEISAGFIPFNDYDVNKALSIASRTGNIKLIHYFIDKGANDWNLGMRYAASNNHIELVKFFIDKGANDWNLGMRYAASNNHIELVKFFKSKLNQNL